MNSGRVISIIMAVLWIALRPVAAELLGTGSAHPVTMLGLSQTVYLEARRRVLLLAEQQSLQQARQMLVQVLHGDPTALTPPARETLSANDRTHA